MKDYDKITKQAQALNHAFVEAFVSYAAYDSRRWMMERQHYDYESNDTTNPVLQVLKQANTSVDSLTSKKTFELYASLFNRNKFEQVTLDLPDNDIYRSEKYGYETKYYSQKGDYKTLDNLGRAIILRSKNPDNTYTLHVSFRGTDTEARTFQNFVTSAYLDMSAYYDAFKPLEKAILEYAKNKDNNITKIHMSGHSLGGAMVSEFFSSKEVQKCKIPMEGFTYGAPGNVKKSFYSVLPAMYHTVKHGKFLQLGKTMVDMFFHAKNNKIERNITHYSHIGDLIPRVAALVYEKQGNLVTLEDVASRDKKETFILSGLSPAHLLPKRKHRNNCHIQNKSFDYKKSNFWDNGREFFHKAVTFQFHDMLRYVINIDNQAQQLINNIGKHQDKKLKEILTTYLDDIMDFTEYREKFDKVTKVNANAMAETITNRLQQTIKMKAMHNGTWGGNLPNNTTLAKRMIDIRQKAFAQKVIHGLSEEFVKLRTM